MESASTAVKASSTATVESASTAALSEGGGSQCQRQQDELQSAHGHLLAKA
jgi:hypothetical protein